ncbi:hypothetical protein NIES3974_46590 [Calothrix sp. NIES-3974]|nr:hypothetical protein NIES3974_46590 [Calothrix sp. NIES-3974]
MVKAFISFLPQHPQFPQYNALQKGAATSWYKHKYRDTTDHVYVMRV